MRSRRTVVARAVGAVVGAVAMMMVAGCSASRDDSDDTLFGAGTSIPTTTTIAPTTTVAPTTTAAPTTTSTTTTSTSSTTTTSTTEAPTTTTEPPGADVPLRFDGLGDARFGLAPDDVIDYLTEKLGSPTADSGWVAAGAVGCEGDEAREMFWDDLRVWFGDESDVSARRRHFFAWTFGPPAQFAPRPDGMETLLGVTIGTSVAELREAYPAARLIVGDAEVDSSAELSEGLSANLTNTTPSGEVLMLIGGTPCSS